MSCKVDFELLGILRHQLNMFGVRPTGLAQKHFKEVSHEPEDVLRDIRRDVDVAARVVPRSIKPLVDALTALVHHFDFAALLPDEDVADLMLAVFSCMRRTVQHTSAGLYELFLWTHLLVCCAQVLILYLWRIPTASLSCDLSRMTVHKVLFGGLKQLCDSSSHQFQTRMCLFTMLSNYLLLRRPSTAPLIPRILVWPSRDCIQFRLHHPDRNCIPVLSHGPEETQSYAICLSVYPTGIQDVLKNAHHLFPLIGRRGQWVLGLQTQPSGFAKLLLVTKTGTQGADMYNGNLNLNIFTELKITVVKDEHTIHVFWDTHALMVRATLTPAEQKPLCREGTRSGLHLGPVSLNDLEADCASDTYLRLATLPLPTTIHGVVHSVDFQNIWGIAFAEPATAAAASSSHRHY